MSGCEEKPEDVELLTLVTDTAAADTTDTDKSLPEQQAEAGQQAEMIEDGAESTCFVHVCGAVVNPGVYELPAGSRIFESVNAAGGFAEDASMDAVNQAMPVEDGSRIWIPTAEEAAQWQEGSAGSIYPVSGESPEEASHLININTASAEMLCTLPGVGQAKAESIIAYREQKGKFTCVEDIMKVEGIKEGLFAKISDKITV